LSKREEITEDREFEGAFVKQPAPGFYDWIVSFDLASLYPHIEMQYNIGPETLVSEDKLPPELLKIKEDHTFTDLLNENIDLSPLDKYGLTMTANFEFYRKDRMSFFSEIKRELYVQRKVFKKKMLEAEQHIVDAQTPEEKRKYGDMKSKSNNMQMGLKILLNGGYGALGNKYFLYYKVENAEAITLTGQLVNKWTCSHVNEFMKRVLSTDDDTWVYSDTDSGYFTIDKFVKSLPSDITDTQAVDMCDQLCEEVVSPEIVDRCQHLSDYTRAYEQKMIWERETIAKRAVFVAKKKYVMAVLDNEGTRYKPEEPKIKIMGMESVKGGMPDFSKEALVSCYTAALTGEESDVHQIVSDTEKYFYGLNVNDIALVKNVNDIEKWEHDINLYKSGTPMHVKASIIHNKMVDDVGAKRVPKIVSGDKIKYVELNMPNPTRNTVVAFDTFMPKEFELEPYVNYDLMFEKAFVQPLQIFLDAVGWHREDVNTLF
jgi:DNA polymerase elongation subunit (family B)